MPQTDRHKKREIPIEFDFYNTLDKLPVEKRCTIIMISCGSTTIKINEHFQTVNAPAVLCISQYDKFQCIEKTHLSAKAFHFTLGILKHALDLKILMTTSVLMRNMFMKEICFTCLPDILEIFREYFI